MYWHMVLAYVFRIRNWPALINVRCSIGGGIKSKSTSKAIQRASRKDAVSFLSVLSRKDTAVSTTTYPGMWFGPAMFHKLYASAQCIQ
eukprot:1147716-Pelagomonas_calceolata.AAC.2